VNLDYPPDEIAARFSHRLVAMHPYANGNGRLDSDAQIAVSPAPTFHPQDIRRRGGGNAPLAVAQPERASAHQAVACFLRLVAPPVVSPSSPRSSSGSL
jgi:hypothetical protein